MRREARLFISITAQELLNFSSPTLVLSRSLSPLYVIKDASSISLLHPVGGGGSAVTGVCDRWTFLTTPRPHSSSLDNLEVAASTNREEKRGSKLEFSGEELSRVERNETL